jgi:hypothetical protein
MRRWLPRQPDLFKTPPLNEVPPLQRTAALKLLTALLTEALFKAEARHDRIDDREAGDDQNHA